MILSQDYLEKRDRISVSLPICMVQTSASSREMHPRCRSSPFVRTRHGSLLDHFVAQSFQILRLCYIKRFQIDNNRFL